MASTNWSSTKTLDFQKSLKILRKVLKALQSSAVILLSGSLLNILVALPSDTLEYIYFKLTVLSHDKQNLKVIKIDSLVLFYVKLKTIMEHLLGDESLTLMMEI